ncbi:MAG: hypothetical protein KDI83_19890 [Gammaproteobacteria bacterium]|nr:hypothetical protein [Gammaproteobacteria bacterium]
MKAWRWLILLILTLPSLLWALEIRHVQHDTGYLLEHGRDSLEISFEITGQAVVQLNIYDARDLLIRRIGSSGSLVAGLHVLRWDGRDNSGHLVPAGVYRYTLDAKAMNGNATTYDLSELTGGERESAREIVWNEQEQTVDYILPDDSLVSILIGLKSGGPLLNTLLDWAPRRAGANSEAWNGFDSSGVINIGKHPDKVISVKAFRLSDNSIIVGNQFKESWIDVSKWGEMKRPVTEITGSRRILSRSNPYRQPAQSRGSVQLEMMIPDSFPRNSDGLAQVQGKVPFSLDVAAEDKPRILQRRFEVAFFVDGILVYENELGFLPMTWYWNTKDINPGNHYVTANLIGYEGNFGSKTMELIVLPGGPPSERTDD